MLEYVALAISAGSLLVAFLGWNDKRVSTHKEYIDGELDNLEADIKDIQTEVSAIKGCVSSVKTSQAVLEERVKNEIAALDKLSDKLDEIYKEIK